MDSTAHAGTSFVLDIVDKAIKFVAVLIGGLWTWWNYRKGRTYEQKLELEVVGTVFVKRNLYVDVRVVVKNIGASQHSVQHEGTFCVLSVIRDDLEEQPIKLFRVFTDNDKMEPGESIDGTEYWRIPQPIDDIVWVKLELRVVSNGVEWRSSCLIRVESENKSLSSEVI